MAKRGFVAEIQRAAKAAERDSQRRSAAAARQTTAAARTAEQSRRAAERAANLAARAATEDQKRLQKEAAEQRIAARLAEAGALNAELAAQEAELEGLLASTLAVDDYLDLDALKAEVRVPPLNPGNLAVPIVGPTLPPKPIPPTYVEPPAPKGVAAALGGKRRHNTAVEDARAKFLQDQQAWEAMCRNLQQVYQRHHSQWVRDEGIRREQLNAAREAYSAHCRAEEVRVREQNEAIDQLKNNLAFDVPDAVQEYVELVLGNSIYPEMLPVQHKGQFNLTTRELELTVSLSEPSALPSVKEYRYVKSSDEIVATQMSAKAQKDRFARIVSQVAVRTLHEVFEADRLGRIHSIALVVAVGRISPATGLRESVPLVSTSAGRDTFQQFDLANVVPSATLSHLGAAVSKAPFDLIPIDARGVRSGGQR